MTMVSHKSSRIRKIMKLAWNGNFLHITGLLMDGITNQTLTRGDRII